MQQWYRACVFEQEEANLVMQAEAQAHALVMGGGSCIPERSWVMFDVRPPPICLSILQAEVHDVVVVGGASRMPGLRGHLEKLFPVHYQAQLHMTDAVVDAVGVCSSLVNVMLQVNALIFCTTIWQRHSSAV